MELSHSMISKYLLFFLGAIPSMLANSLLQSLLNTWTTLFVAVFFGTSAGFIVKRYWDKYLVFNSPLHTYIKSSIIATMSSVIIEYLLISVFDIFYASITSLFIGYNLKFFCDYHQLYHGEYEKPMKN